jgi:UDP-N-acetylglucosamine--N-acetylmuramyl-(pentapeptide) pyrophosphoryl-undecaprenol N-acetylglucosamine transferase
MARAQLVVTRAGAMTLAEVCAAGRPALLVPLALAGGHQVDNALLLADAGAAALLAAFEASAPRLAELLGEMLTDPGRLRAMAGAARQRARPDAAAAIADRAEALAGPVEDRR